MPLSSENFDQGFLVDHEWLAGVALDSEQGYFAYIINYLTGDEVYSHRFQSLDTAITELNRIPRQWAFQPCSECGCGNATCEGKSCPVRK